MPQNVRDVYFMMGLQTIAYIASEIHIHTSQTYTNSNSIYRFANHYIVTLWLTFDNVSLRNHFYDL